MLPRNQRNLLALTAGALLAGSLAACTPPKDSEPAMEVARQGLIPGIPLDSAFVPITCLGGNLSNNDALGDPVTGNQDRDMVGDATYPAYYRAANAADVFFRMRMNGDPRKPSGTALQPSSWDVLVDTDGDYTTYEYMLTADGNMGGTAVRWVRNSIRDPSDPRDPANDQAGDLLNDFTPHADYWDVKPSGDGSLFSGDIDYFITLRLPRAVLLAVPGFSFANQFVVWGGTNAQNYSLNADFGCIAGMPADLAGPRSDPIYLDPTGHPSALPDTVTTPEDTAITTAVLANDTGLEDTPITVTIVTSPANGAVVVNGDNTITYTPAANYNGPASYVYRVTDTTPESSTATVSITVTPVDDGPPNAVADTVSTPEDTTITVDVLANDTNLVDAPVTVTISAQPANGTVVVNPDGTVTYTPAANYSGPDSFTYTVTDADGQTSSATVSFTVTPVDDGPPNAVADTASTPEDTAMTVAVLANDTNLVDAPVTVTISAQPANGTVVVNPDGTVTYTPDADYSGPDSFTYAVTDADGQLSTATVSINVAPVDDGPPSAQDDIASLPEDSAITTDVLANDTNLVDGPVSVSIATQPAHGTVTLNPDGTITYTPNPDYIGPDSFTYTVTDADGQTSTATVSFNVTPINDAPLARDDAASGPGVQDGIVIDVLTNDFDVDGDTLAVDSVTQPANGTVTVNLDGTVTYVPTLGYTGSDSFTYTIRDGNGGTATATVNINVGPGDSDGDGLTDTEETTRGTNPLDNDSDDDGVPDGSEPSWSDDSDGDGMVNALDSDSDNDGILDGTEMGITTPAAGTDLLAGMFVADADPSTTTDPLNRDSDAGGVNDGDEDTNHNGRVDAGERDPRLGQDDIPVTVAYGVAGGGCTAAGGGLSPLLALALLAARRRRSRAAR